MDIRNYFSCSEPDKPVIKKVDKTKKILIRYEKKKKKYFMINFEEMRKLYNGNFDEFVKVYYNDDIKQIISFFRKRVKNELEYFVRLTEEFHLILKNKFTKVFIQVYNILKLIKKYDENIQHVIRGSAGSSLICYYMNITNIDPIEEKISLGRFMHKKRTDTPDIDIDFPWNKRDKIYELIFDKYKNRVARISNHIHYKYKSALKEAIREQGYNKFIPKDFKLEDIFDDSETIDNIIKRANELDGDFRMYSLHCGGIVIFDKNVPDDLYLKDFLLNRKISGKHITNKSINEEKYGKQIKYDKDDVEDNNLIKIDILSNRGLGQLADISNMKIEDYPDDELVYKYLSKGNNLGLTFAESRGMRKLFYILKPKNIKDIAFILALIRPAASGNSQKTDFLRYDNIFQTNTQKMRKKIQNYIVYDDDAIQFIQKLFKIPEYEADYFRKGFSKNNKFVKKKFLEKLNKLEEYNSEEKNFIYEQLEELKEYSFCKSHAISYAKLVYALVYNKFYNPKEFWCASLNNCNSSYRKWVHYRQAHSSGLELTIGEPIWKIRNNKIISDKSITRFKINDVVDYFKYGYWIGKDFLPNMYYKTEIKLGIKYYTKKGIEKYKFIDKKDKHKYKDLLEIKTINFRGLVATGRCFKDKNNVRNKKITFFTLGYDNDKYIDIILYGHYPVSKIHCIEGYGILKDEKYCPYVNVEKFKFSIIE